jgi:hypothetical protein
MAKTLKGRIIVPSYAYQTAPDDGFMVAVNNVEKGMDGNTAQHAAIPDRQPQSRRGRLRGLHGGRSRRRQESRFR